MYFFERNEAYKDRIACIDDAGQSYTYEQLWDMGDALTEGVRPRTVVLLECSNDVESVAKYLAYLRRRCPVILIGKNVEASLVDAMRATYVQDTGDDAQHLGDATPDVAPDLALLLSTSGSIGAQKLVRLSYDNLQSNCDAIVEYLGLTDSERPITTLPMEYTYGLSVIHSHLAVGATIILTNKTLFDAGFWDMVERYEVTSMAGVPYTYAMFDRLRLTQMDLPHLKTLTQAGGHLSPELQEKYARWAKETGRRFFVMYGQTEATARMSYLPPERCLEKPGSIGIPIPGGRLELENDGELVYYGPNVSLGYATCREDLAKPDEHNGRLETGDIGYKDEEGYFYITGRKKRFIKLQGKRIGLDHVQETLQENFAWDDIVCTGVDDKGLTVWTTKELDEEKVTALFEEKMGIRGRMVAIRVIDAIPRNPSGKVVYKDLKGETE